MEQYLAFRLSAELKISSEQIVREEWEHLLLKELYESLLGRELILRGGTALRLAYGSPRFSDDLDFSLFRDVDPLEFKDNISTTYSLLPKLGEVKISDLTSKRFTHLAEFRIREPWQTMAFSIKIEVSRRDTYPRDKQCYQLLLLSSPVTNIQVLANVATLEQIYSEKLRALEERKEPRDLFDLWFISQRLKREFFPQTYAIDRKELIRELHKYLPRNFWKAVEELAAYGS